MRAAQDVDAFRSGVLGFLQARLDVLRTLDAYDRKRDGPEPRQRFELLELRGPQQPGIGQHRQPPHLGKQLHQEFEALDVEFRGQDADAGRVAGAIGERSDIAFLHHIVGEADDGNGVRRRLRGADGRASRA